MRQPPRRFAPDDSGRGARRGDLSSVNPWSVWSRSFSTVGDAWCHAATPTTRPAEGKVVVEADQGLRLIEKRPVDDPLALGSDAEPASASTPAAERAQSVEAPSSGSCPAVASDERAGHRGARHFGHSHPR